MNTCEIMFHNFCKHRLIQWSPYLYIIVCTTISPELESNILIFLFKCRIMDERFSNSALGHLSNECAITFTIVIRFASNFIYTISPFMYPSTRRKEIFRRRENIINNFIQKSSITEIYCHCTCDKYTKYIVLANTVVSLIKTIRKRNECACSSNILHWMQAILFLHKNSVSIPT